jgi:fatty-acid peroxygenase
VRKVVEAIRSGVIDAPAGSAALAIAWHRDGEGSLLDTDVAAVELINVLRPTVAVARFVTFAALALYDHPECCPRVAADDAYLEWFVQEVRRFYPFFPVVGGRAAHEFEWRGHTFTKDAWVLFDLYGTNHDDRIWDAPEEFVPERFRTWDGSAYNFVPQGAGDLETGHRCPGERITIEIVKRAVRLLATRMRYEIPDQDLSIDLTRLPAIPESRMRLRNVRRA